jgi:hypothetical protein
MLYGVSEDVRNYCYRHAEECARRAASQSNARLRQDYLELERRWLSLAHSSHEEGAFEAVGESRDY